MRKRNSFDAWSGPKLPSDSCSASVAVNVSLQEKGGSSNSEAVLMLNGKGKVYRSSAHYPQSLTEPNDRVSVTRSHRAIAGKPAPGPLFPQAASVGDLLADAS